MALTEEMERWINTGLSQGFSEERLKQELLNSGYTTGEIEQIFREFDEKVERKEKVTKRGPTKKKRILVSGIIFLVIIVFVGFQVRHYLKLPEASIKLPEISKEGVVQKEEAAPKEEVIQKKEEAQSEVPTQETPAPSELPEDEWSKLGVLSPPKGASVQFTYKGIDFMRSPKRSFSEQEVWLLKYFLDITPKKLLETPPEAVVTYEPEELNIQSIGFNFAIAYASGPFIFFSEESFSPEGLTGLTPADDSIDAAFRTFEHELMHVAQFHAVPDSVKQKVINKEIYTKNMIYYSEILPEFIEAIGWNDTNPDERWFSWRLPKDEESQKTTSHGRSNPIEDQADTFAGCVLTDNERFSKARINWCREWLGSEITKIEDNKLPIYPESKAVKAMFGRISDEEIVDRYKQDFPLADVQTWSVSEENQIEKVKNFFETELHQRGWSGSFSKEVTKYNVIIYTGDFENPYRDVNVQLKSYDVSDYLVAPDGTTIAVVSGYKME